MKVSEYRPINPISLTIPLTDDPKLWPPLTDEEKLALQQPSTKWCLTHDVSVPFVAEKDFRAVPDAKTTEEAVGMRFIDPAELAKHAAARANRKIIYRDNRTTMIGWSEGLSSVTLQKRMSAIDAFRFTTPADVSNKDIVDKAVGLVEYKSEPSKPTEWRKLSTWQALKHWLRGGEVKRDSND